MIWDSVADGTLFVKRAGREKIECRVCGGRGYPGGRWMDAHRRGHAPCSSGCGRQLTLLTNGKPRNHGRCPRVQ